MCGALEGAERASLDVVIEEGNRGPLDDSELRLLVRVRRKV
jgi:hypothetical protein